MIAVREDMNLKFNRPSRFGGSPSEKENNHVVFLLDSKCPLNVSSREYINEQIKRKIENERTFTERGKILWSEGVGDSRTYVVLFHKYVAHSTRTPVPAPLRHDSFKIPFGESCERRKFSLSNEKHREIHSKS